MQVQVQVQALLLLLLLPAVLAAFEGVEFRGGVGAHQLTVLVVHLFVAPVEERRSVEEKGKQCVGSGSWRRRRVRASARVSTRGARMGCGL